MSPLHLVRAVIILGLLLGSSLHAQDLKTAHASQSAHPLKMRATVSVLTEHLGSDGVIYHPNAVAHTMAHLKLPSGVMFGIWHYIANQNHQELDIGAGYQQHVGHWEFEGGIKYRGMPDLLAAPYGDILVPEVEAKHEYDLGNHKLLPYVNIEYPIYLEQAHSVGIWEVSGGLEHEWDVVHSVHVEQRVSVQFNTAAHHHQAAVLSFYRASVRYDLTEHVAAVVSGVGMLPATPLHDGRRATGLLGVGLTYRM